jgi:hypothetical protein
VKVNKAVYRAARQQNLGKVKGRYHHKGALGWLFALCLVVVSLMLLILAPDAPSQQLFEWSTDAGVGATFLIIAQVYGRRRLLYLFEGGVVVTNWNGKPKLIVRWNDIVQIDAKDGHLYAERILVPWHTRRVLLRDGGSLELCDYAHARDVSSEIARELGTAGR